MYSILVKKLVKTIIAKPIVKWAGGKGKTAKCILPELQDTYNTYYEPFVGGGAIFFELLKLNKFKRAVIGDSNPDLILTYLVIQNNVEDLIVELKKKKYVYDKNIYLKIRSQDVTHLTDLQRVARFIYLNKTCFNGLWRVNKSGHFNVPFGTYNNPNICDEENLRSVATALKKVKIIQGDFENIVKGAKKGDLIYFDPPYIPLSSTSKFTSYNSAGFSEEDHYRLRALFGKFVNDGVKVILSNSSSTLSYELYSKYRIIEIEGQRVIGGPAGYRQPVKELIVVGDLNNVIRKSGHH